MSNAVYGRRQVPWSAHSFEVHSIDLHSETALTLKQDTHYRWKFKLDFYILAFKPLLALMIEEIVGLPVGILALSTVARHVVLDFDFQGMLLTIRQIPVTARIVLQLAFIQSWHFRWIDGYELVLFVPFARKLMDFGTRWIGPPYQCRTNRARHSPSGTASAAPSPKTTPFSQKKQKRQSDSASTTHPSRSNRCVIVAFILVTARVTLSLISVDAPWHRCMINAPSSMPALETLIKSWELDSAMT